MKTEHKVHYRKNIGHTYATWFDSLFMTMETPTKYPLFQIKIIQISKQTLKNFYYNIYHSTKPNKIIKIIAFSTKSFHISLVSLF